MQGISLTSYDLLVSTDLTYLKDRIERLLFVGYGEVLGFPLDGSRIMNYFWQVADEQTANAILLEVKRLITTYEPDLVLESAGVSLNPDSDGQVAVLVELTISFKNDPYETELLSVGMTRPG